MNVLANPRALAFAVCSALFFAQLGVLGTVSQLSAAAGDGTAPRSVVTPPAAPQAPAFPAAPAAGPAVSI